MSLLTRTGRTRSILGRRALLTERRPGPRRRGRSRRTTDFRRCSLCGVGSRGWLRLYGVGICPGRGEDGRGPPPPGLLGVLRHRVKRTIGSRSVCCATSREKDEGLRLPAARGRKVAIPAVIRVAWARSGHKPPETRSRCYAGSRAGRPEKCLHRRHFTPGEDIARQPAVLRWQRGGRRFEPGWLHSRISRESAERGRLYWPPSVSTRCPNASPRAS